MAFSEHLRTLRTIGNPGVNKMNNTSASLHNQIGKLMLVLFIKHNEETQK